MGSRRIVDVAAAAGVSPTTVSHALSGKRAVSEATKARIFAVIEDLDYQPNLVAKGLREQQTHTFALLVPDIANPYYTASARALQDGVSDDGYLTLLGNTDGDRDREHALLREMVARGADGIALHTLTSTPAEVRQIVGPSIALVMVTADDGTGAADIVVSDDAVGIGEAVGFLADAGVRDVGFVSGPEGQAPGTGRLAAFRAAISARGLNVRDEWVTNSSYTRDGGFHAAVGLLSREDRPKALFCANDLIAIGVLDAARYCGVDVPNDLAVVGFDDIETANLVTPRLTTIINPAAATGAAMATALLRRIQLGSEAPHSFTVVKTSFIRRQSA
jgi:LacI family transcriptional regulator